MSYIEQFEQELSKKLTSSETGEQIVRWVSEKILESYKNGIVAGRKKAAVSRKGESRQNGSAAKAE
jgi:uncharacterized membrane-anchored protein